MSIDEIQILIRNLTSFGFGAIVSAVIGFLIIRFYFPSYLGEKAKNLATREDIAAITHEMEKVRIEYSSLVEELKARHQLRLAAVDKRLQAHQEAFTKWTELMATVHSSDIHKTVIDCQSWWDKNCVYLEPKVRKAFVAAYRAASDHKSLTQPGGDVNAIKENWQKILGFGNSLFEAIQLPSLSELETQSISKENAKIL